jgi:hypothetical protein
MAEVAHDRPGQATPVTRAQELARTLQAKLGQGYSIESQNDTQAVLRMKGRKRWFGRSVVSRQVVSVDEFGKTKFVKIDDDTG